jgi:hypothetical protein
MHGSVVLEDCQFTEPVYAQGIHTNRTSPIDRGAFGLTDLRLAYATGTRAVRWFGGGGVGWVWSRDVPVVMLGTGIELGTLVRLVVDGDLVAYRIPFETVTAEWRDFEVVEVLERRREHEWRTGFSVRLGLEVAPRILR